MLGLDKDRVHAGPKSSFSATVTVAYSRRHSDQSNKAEEVTVVLRFRKEGMVEVRRLPGKKLEEVAKRVKDFHATWRPLKDFALEALTKYVLFANKAHRRIKHG